MDAVKLEKKVAWPTLVRELLGSPIPLSEADIQKHKPILIMLQERLALLRRLGGPAVSFSPALSALFDRASKLR